MQIKLNIVSAKDWLKLHPYDKAGAVDLYYVNLCNKVLRIIQKSKLTYLFETQKEQISLSLVLVAYFEDVISENTLIGDPVFDDMSQKLEITKNTERAFLKVNNGSTITFIKGKQEFINYIVENQIIKLELDASAFSPYVFPLLMDNLDFMLRFYRKRRYWTEPTVSIGNYTEEL
ncbi:MAG: DUF3843 family protein [Dysgonamonadaceae bacterium]|jgi:hypothetical protein|nr:DUF3843 family protein [Dysgonamonadaceae bacterium]